MEPVFRHCQNAATTILVIGLMAAGCVAQADTVTLTLPDGDVAPGQTAELRIRVAGFAEGTTLQFTLQWDPAVLEFQSVDEYGLPGLGAENFGVFADAGKLTVSWDDLNGKTSTLEDGAVFCRLRLRAIGEVGRDSVLRLSDKPTVAEATINLQLAAIDVVEGTVRIIREEIPPRFVETPADQAIEAGSAAELKVIAEGTAPLKFEWFKNDTVISGAEGPILELAKVTQDDAGFYRVRVSNAFGSATSPQAMLDVIVIEPANSGDLDGDGMTDVVLMSDEGELVAWLMEGVSVLAERVFDPPTVNGSGFKVVGTGDFNGDGALDLVFQHPDGTLATWLLDELALAEAALIDPAHPGDLAWRVMAAADLDGDRWCDLLFQHNDGTLAAWFLHAHQLRSPELLSPSRVNDHRWRIAAAPDLDGDGKPDLLFQHDDGTLATWLLDRTTLRQAALLEPAHPGNSNWRATATGDWNGDGSADILFQNSADGSVGVWFMNHLELKDAVLLPRKLEPGQRVVGP